MFQVFGRQELEHVHQRGTPPPRILVFFICVNFRYRSDHVLGHVVAFFRVGQYLVNWHVRVVGDRLIGPDLFLDLDTSGNWTTAGRRLFRGYLRFGYILGLRKNNNDEDKTQIETTRPHFAIEKTYTHNAYGR